MKDEQAQSHSDTELMELAARVHAAAEPDGAWALCLARAIAGGPDAVRALGAFGEAQFCVENSMVVGNLDDSLSVPIVAVCPHCGCRSAVMTARTLAYPAPVGRDE
jgi:hypothetical protein